MKKLIYLLLVLSFFSCEKNEVIDMADASDMNNIPRTRAMSSDVTVENGYLVLKNWHVLDSISKLCADMTDVERSVWEKNLGFESAYTYFQPYFEAFDNLQTESEMLDFQNHHKNILKIINDEDCCDVDYPFATQGRAGILSKEGKIKIGNTLWIYKEDRKITIINTNKAKEVKYSNAQVSDKDTEIIVDYYNAPKTRMGQWEGSVSLWSKNYEESKRRYFCSLDKYVETVDNETRLYIQFYQQGKKKKKIGGWSVYRTTYSCKINKLIIDGKDYTGTSRLVESSEGRGGRYFGIVALSGTGMLPYVQINLTHMTRGLDPHENMDYSSPHVPVGSYNVILDIKNRYTPINN